MLSLCEGLCKLDLVNFVVLYSFMGVTQKIMTNYINLYLNCGDRGVKINVRNEGERAMGALSSCSSF